MGEDIKPKRCSSSNSIEQATELIVRYKQNRTPATYCCKHLNLKNRVTSDLYRIQFMRTVRMLCEIYEVKECDMIFISLKHRHRKNKSIKKIYNIVDNYLTQDLFENL